MRQLLPHPAEVDPARAHAAADRPHLPDRPWVLLNMVASVDGATAVDGVSGELGGAADRSVFSAIRAVADVIVAAAGTVRADGYGPPRTPPAQQAARVARGQAPYPRIAIVSRTLDLDERTPLFTATPTRPLVFTTTTSDPERRRTLAQVADVVADEAEVTPGGIVTHLHRLGAHTVLLEGGPSLNGRFHHAGLLDEVNLTTAPALVGGDSPRILREGPQDLTPLRLAHLWEEDGVLLARYCRR